MLKAKITPLYERLSRDDELNGDSFSIQNQKFMLEDYARRNGFPNPTHFTDDGISGTRFDRPGFTAMMEQVEAGNVEAIIVKDMSRLGRDYLKVGQVMEILRQRGVRLIAINDNVDTAKGDSDMTPFLNIMYEFYARDTSRKIKSVFKAKGMSGKHMTGTVIYGYLWDEKRENWIVDEEAAAIVRRIFAMTLEGYGPYQISSRLSQEKIEIPSVHLARYGEGVNQNRAIKDIYGWGSSTIVNILKKREYLGHTVNFKTQKHFKDKKSHYVDESEWTIFENTHEPIITQEMYDNVQRIRSNVRRYPDGWGEAAPLTGLLYCADCGGKMYVHRVNNGKRVSQYTCSQYSKVPVGTLCPTQHRIAESVVLSLVSDTLHAIADYAHHQSAEVLLSSAPEGPQTARNGHSKQRRKLPMADNRKYYYLKLKENYFDDDSIVLLESMQDGILYSYILLKLYLKSLKHGGRLQLDESIPYTPQMIATITRQQIGTVERAIKIFLQLGLMEQMQDGAFYMTNIELLIGQSSTEGERKRRARQANRIALNPGGQMSAHCPDIRPPEIERVREPLI